MTAPPRPRPRSMPVGHRIRSQRQRRGLTQAELARRLGISASYLNLIEHDRRTAAGGLLVRIADELAIDLHALSGTEELRLLSELGEIASDPAFAGQPPEPAEIARLVGQMPGLARSVLALYRAYRDAEGAAAALRDRLAQDPFLAEASHQVLTLITSIRAFSEILSDYEDLQPGERRRFIAALASESRRLSHSANRLFEFVDSQAGRHPQPSPVQEAEDFIQDRGNHFPGLEAIAERLRDRLGSEADADGLAGFLRRRHGVTVATRPADALPPGGERYEAEAGRLELSDMLAPSRRRFRIARALARLEAGEAIDASLADAAFRSPEAAALARDVLVSYAAGALLFPYGEVLAAAEETGYDVDRLARRFDASFEQAAHRLTTLRRAGASGIPFHFLRRDLTGNLSKRFSASGLRLPHYSSVCPRWILHGALLAPEQTHAQVARMPDGSAYLFVARASAGPAGGFGASRPARAVMLGCELSFAGRTVYGRHLDLDADGLGAPVGVTCRQCPRQDCGERLEPMLPGPLAEPAPDSTVMPAGAPAAARL